MRTLGLREAKQVAPSLTASQFSVDSRLGQGPHLNSLTARSRKPEYTSQGKHESLDISNHLKARGLSVSLCPASQHDTAHPATGCPSWKGTVRSRHTPGETHRAEAHSRALSLKPAGLLRASGVWVRLGHIRSPKCPPSLLASGGAGAGGARPSCSRSAGG